MSIKSCNTDTDKKHKPYIDFYDSLEKEKENGICEYWGLGIENESYLMLSNPAIKNKTILHNHKSERYSVDYYKNYDMYLFSQTIKPFANANANANMINMPIYINGYMFQNVDIYGQHKTHYSTSANSNKKYCGMSIDEYMNYVSPEYKNLFKKYKSN